MSERPSQPRDALAQEELQRFIYACSHERRSPTTHRLIDASSYGWIHLFIRNNGEDAPPQEPGDDWLDPHDADPAQIESFFARVAIRLRNTGAFDYATSLQEHFHKLAESSQTPWPHG